MLWHFRQLIRPARNTLWIRVLPHCGQAGGEPQLFPEVFTLMAVMTRLTFELSHFGHPGLAASCAEMDSMTVNS